MRTRNCILTLTLLVLPTLGGCRSTPEAPPLPGGRRSALEVSSLFNPKNVGNIQIVVSPKNLSTPRIGITYWTDSLDPFVLTLATEGDGFHIEVPGSWYDMEKESTLTVGEIDGSIAVYLTDSVQENLLLQNTSYKIDDDPGVNSATGTWQGWNAQTGKHEFLLGIIYKDMLFWIKIEADA